MRGQGARGRHWLQVFHVQAEERLPSRLAAQIGQSSHCTFASPASSPGPVLDLKIQTQSSGLVPSGRLVLTSFRLLSSCTPTERMIQASLSGCVRIRPEKLHAGQTFVAGSSTSYVLFRSCCRSRLIYASTHLRLTVDARLSWRR